MDIVNDIKTKGYFKFVDFFSDGESQLLKDEVVTCIKTFGDDHGWGMHARVMPANYSHMPHIKRLVFDNKTVNRVIDQYYGRCQRFMQTFLSWEKGYVEDNQLGRHSWMHVDPYASLKFAFFPLGATEETGALRAIPGTREEGKIVRERFMSRNPKGILGGIAHRMVDFREQCPHLITHDEDEAIPLEATSRDLFVLDTDVYHGGGRILLNDSERIAVYMHNRP